MLKKTIPCPHLGAAAYFSTLYDQFISGRHGKTTRFKGAIPAGRRPGRQDRLYTQACERASQTQTDDLIGFLNIIGEKSLPAACDQRIGNLVTVKNSFPPGQPAYDIHTLCPASPFIDFALDFLKISDRHSGRSPTVETQCWRRFPLQSLIKHGFVDRHVFTGAVLPVRNQPPGHRPVSVGFLLHDKIVISRGIQKIVELVKIVHFDNHQPAGVVGIAIDNADVVVDILIDADNSSAH